MMEQVIRECIDDLSREIKHALCIQLKEQELAINRARRTGLSQAVQTHAGEQAALEQPMVPGEGHKRRKLADIP